VGVTEVTVAAPASTTGKVSGFVYSVLDRGMPHIVFVLAAMALFIAIGSAAVAGERGARLAAARS
jgi:hypothetical protein